MSTQPLRRSEAVASLFVLEERRPERRVTCRKCGRRSRFPQIRFGNGCRVNRALRGPQHGLIHVWAGREERHGPRQRFAPQAMGSRAGGTGTDALASITSPTLRKTATSLDEAAMSARRVADEFGHSRRRRRKASPGAEESGWTRRPPSHWRARQATSRPLAKVMADNGQRRRPDT
jgi:hypothetical protein